MSILKGSNLILNSLLLLLLRSKKTLIPSSVFQRSITHKTWRKDDLPSFPIHRMKKDLPIHIQQIIQPFQDPEIQEPRRYGRGEKLYRYSLFLPVPPRKDNYRTSDNKVELEGSPGASVWVRAFLDPNNMVWFEAHWDDPDDLNFVTKGLCSILFQYISCISVDELTPDFFDLLIHTLTSSRLHPSNIHVPNFPRLSTNLDFFKIIEFMKKKCLVLADEKTAREKSVVLERMKEKLESELGPVELEHNLRIVSNELEGTTADERRVMIYTLLKEYEFAKPNNNITTR